MGVHQKKIPVQELAIGMFVSDLDRPWHQTPFPIQGFYIRSDEEIRALTSYCKSVYVDVAEKQGSSAKVTPFAARSRPDSERSLKLPPAQIRHARRYETVVPLSRELKQAEKVFQAMQDSLQELQAQARTGELDPTRIAAAADGMVQSVIRNPNALLWLARVRHRDEYSFSHSINTAVWTLVFGRELGFQPDLLQQLGTGALLCHLGKTRLPRELFKPETEMTSEELKVYRQYPEIGAEILANTGMPSGVVNLVRYHRERHNGTGFPQGVTGDKIPLLAKVVSVAEHYQALIAPREEFVPLSPAQAVARLYEARNIQFQEDLVERFIQAVGIYPTGTVVALSDDQIGVVLSHRPNRRLWPTVMVLTDRQGQPLKEGRVIDLADYNEGRGLEESLQIAGCMPQGMAGVDPADYPVTGSSGRWSWRRLVG